MLRVSVIKRGQPIEAMRCEKQMHLSTISKKCVGWFSRRQRPINGEEKKDNTGNRRGKRVEAQSDAHGEAKRAGSFVPVAQRRLALMQFDLKGR